MRRMRVGLGAFAASERNAGRDEGKTLEETKELKY